MAKKAKATKVTVADLSGEFGIDGRKIRQIIRGLGMNAPAVEREEGTFGPRAKYEWTEKSKELAKIRKALKDADSDATTAKKSKKSKKGKAKAEPDVEEDDEDEDDDDDDEDDDDD